MVVVVVVVVIAVAIVVLSCNMLLDDCSDVLLVLLLGRGERLTLDDAEVEERDPVLSGDFGGIACDKGVGVIGFDFLVTICDVVLTEMVPSTLLVPLPVPCNLSNEIACFSFFSL